MVNYKDFIKQVARETGYSQKNIQEVLDNAEAILIENIKNDENVKIFKNFTIAPSHTTEKEGVIPRTGERIVYPPRRMVKLKLSQNLKMAIR